MVTFASLKIESLHMKKGIIFFLFVQFSLVSNAQNDTLITLGNDIVTSQDFLAVYNKNKNVGKDIDPKTPAEYLELYINFKLKVKAAVDMGKDTLPGFVREFSGYRAQLAKPYLVDKKAEDEVIAEAYERMKQEVRAGHIMLDLPADALPADTLTTYNALIKIRKEIIAGASFEDKAKEISTDTYSAVKGGDLGYFTVFNMVYAFESAAYNTPVGELSMPVRSQYGYHLVKVYDRRANRGKVRVAQIYVSSNDKMPEEKRAEAERKVNEIYTQLETGVEFELLCKQYSDDKSTSSKGGEMKAFGLNEMLYEFQEMAFALENVGDYTKPFKSEKGWHVVKLLEKIPVSSFEDSERTIKDAIKGDVRSSKGVNSLIARLKKEYSFKEYTKRLKDYNKVIDKSFLEGQWDAQKAANLSKLIFVLDGQKYTQKEFTAYLAANQRKSRAASTVEKEVNKAYNSWVNTTIMQYENSKLEEKYPEFRLLVNEYRDGILLFDLTQELVWDKASKDTTGLKEFYNKNKEDYMWGDRVNAVVYSCVSKSTATKVIKSLKKGMTMDKVLEKYNVSSELNVKADSSFFSIGQNKFVDSFAWSEGVSEIVMEDERSKFIYVYSVHEPEPKELYEARGLIISDYQKELEKEWIASLREKYPVEVNEPLFLRITADID
jgi:peptidyl-prolyl cis-trans isomerase SurA